MKCHVGSLAVVVGFLVSSCSTSGTPPTASPLPQASKIVGTIPFRAMQTELYAASGSSLIVLVIPPTAPRSR